MKYSEHARLIALIGALGTIAGLLLWASQTSIGQTSAGPASADQASDWLIIATVFALPVLAAFIGLLRRRVYTAAWASMLAVLYMGYTLAEYIISDGSSGIWLTLASSTLLFAGCVLYPRLRMREAGAGQPSKR